MLFSGGVSHPPHTPIATALISAVYRVNDTVLTIEIHYRVILNILLYVTLAINTVKGVTCMVECKYRRSMPWVNRKLVNSTNSVYSIDCDRSEYQGLWLCTELASS